MDPFLEQLVECFGHEKIIKWLCEGSMAIIRNLAVKFNDREAFYKYNLYYFKYAVAIPDPSKKDLHYFSYSVKFEKYCYWRIRMEGFYDMDDFPCEMIRDYVERYQGEIINIPPLAQKAIMQQYYFFVSGLYDGSRIGKYGAPFGEGYPYLRVGAWRGNGWDGGKIFLVIVNKDNKGREYYDMASYNDHCWIYLKKDVLMYDQNYLTDLYHPAYDFVIEYDRHLIAAAQRMIRMIFSYSLRPLIDEIPGIEFVKLPPAINKFPLPAAMVTASEGEISAAVREFIEEGWKFNQTDTYQLKALQQEIDTIENAINETEDEAELAELEERKKYFQDAYSRELDKQLENPVYLSALSSVLRESDFKFSTP